MIFVIPLSFFSGIFIVYSCVSQINMVIVLHRELYFESVLLVFVYLTISIYHHQIPNITNIGLTPRKIKKAAIVGGGLMGSGIATVLILNNFKVILKEINEQFLSAGINRVKGRPFFPISQNFIGIVFIVPQEFVLLSRKSAEFCQEGTTYQRGLWKEIFSTIRCSRLWTVQRCRFSHWGRSNIYVQLFLIYILWDRTAYAALWPIWVVDSDKVNMCLGSSS